jgi:hypothetical protein
VNKWKYYNSAIVSDNEPRIPVIGKVDHRALFAQYKSAYFIKYITRFDLPEETEWWYCIKDDVFRIEDLKSKRRNVVKKGLDNFITQIIDPNLYIDGFFEIIKTSLLEYNHDIKINREDIVQKCAYLSEDESSIIIGSFFREEPEKLAGYLWLKRNGNCLNLVEQHVIPDYEKFQINAALICFACDYMNDEIAVGAYLSDGERNILHQTAFQDYLEKYFGFRKAYCDLKIIYRFYIKVFVWLLFPFRNCIDNYCKSHDISVLKKINSVLFLEKIRRSFNE